MPPQPIENKIDSLDRRLTKLKQLPAQIDEVALQVSQLRTEARVEFAAVRAQIG